MAKVVGVSNFDNETVNDILICENATLYFAEKIAKLLNGQESDHSTYYYKVVDDNYKLYKWEP